MTDAQVYKNLPPEAQQNFLPYFENFKNILGDNLSSVFVYGSAAGKNFVPGVSDINSAFVLKAIDPNILQSCVALVTAGLKKKISAPLFFTKQDIITSLDIFPIEFLEMKEHHVLIFGEDILSAVTVPDQYVRIFCEQQIKGKVIRLRQAFLGAGGQYEPLANTLKDSLTTLIPVFRNLLRLKGGTPPTDKVEILTRLSQDFGLDEKVFKVIYQHKIGEQRLPRQSVADHFNQYLTQLTVLADKVDAL